MKKLLLPSAACVMFALSTGLYANFEPSEDAFNKKEATEEEEEAAGPATACHKDCASNLQTCRTEVQAKGSFNMFKCLREAKECRDNC